MSDESKPTTVRLKATRRQQLERAAYILQRSQSAIIDEALENWFRENNFLKRYQLSVNADHIVLAEIDDDQVHIKDVRLRNGVPVEQIAREYSHTFNAPIQVVEET
jgi:predicted transcriptional regulator